MNLIAGQGAGSVGVSYSLRNKMWKSKERIDSLGFSVPHSDASFSIGWSLPASVSAKHGNRGGKARSGNLPSALHSDGGTTPCQEVCIWLPPPLLLSREGCMRAMGVTEGHKADAAGQVLANQVH